MVVEERKDEDGGQIKVGGWWMSGAECGLHKGLSDPRDRGGRWTCRWLSPQRSWDLSNYTQALGISLLGCAGKCSSEPG